MVNIIIQLSKYVIIILMAAYTFSCFSIFTRNYEDEEKRVLIRQDVLMFLLQFAAFGTMYLATKDIRILFLYAVLTVILLAVILLYNLIYPNVSRLVVNNMCMLITVGMIMITRLSADNPSPYGTAVRQLVFVALGITFGLVVPVLIRKMKFLDQWTYIYAAVGGAALLAVALFAQISGGAKLGFEIAGINIQPSEFVKIIFVFFVAASLNKSKEFKNIVVTTAIAAAHVLILVLSTDLGAALIFFVVYLVMLFVAVLVIEGISTFLKAYLDGRIKRNTTANVIISVCIMALFVYSLSAVKDVSTSKLGIKVVGAIMHGITHPDWEYMFMTGKSGVMYLMLETIAIAVAGTCAGAVFAVILTLINSRKFIPAPMAFIGRLVVMAIRTVPVYVYGLIFIRVTGPGSFAGVLTMMMCSIGLLTKRFTVAVDNWNMAAWNACKCAGTGFIARLRHVAVPELKFQFKDAVMYRLDVNVRSASTLGLVGAGGIGAPLIVYMNNYRWDAVGSILIVLFVVVLLIELLSKCLKRIH